nr:N-acetylmuramoyl-L-alanine amidase [Petrachloros mirabilis]
MAGRLTFWRFNPQQSRIELVADEGMQPRAFILMNPTRLVIDLPNTTVPRARDRTQISRFVRAVRVAQHDRQTTRVVLELSPGFTLRADQVRVRGIAPNRWFVQLPNFLAIQDLDADALKTATISVPPPQIPAPQVTVASRPATGQVVVIDPGHGGVDPGAVGRGGLQEKGVVLDISNHVSRVLQQQGVTVRMTRTSDQNVELAPRVALANGVRANVFVSIHANAISLSRPDVNGLETYYFQTGYQLAQRIHRSILQRVDVRDRGIRQARFYVLRNTTMPAVLVEVGFVTGQIDAARLQTPSYRQQMGEAIAQGILNYLQGR